MKIFGFAIIFSLILIAIFRFGFKSNRGIGKGVTFSRPEPFDRKQKLTLYLMLLMMVIVLIFPLLKLALPDNALIGTIAGKVDVGLVAFCFTIIALLFDLAPQKEVIARVDKNSLCKTYKVIHKNGVIACLPGVNAGLEKKVNE